MCNEGSSGRDGESCLGILIFPLEIDVSYGCVARSEWDTECRMISPVFPLDVGIGSLSLEIDLDR